MKRISWMMTIGLTCAWLLLNNTVSLIQIVVGAALAAALVAAAAPLRPLRARLRKPSVILRLFGRLLIDIVQSNFAVARIILFVRKQDIRSGSVVIPLELRDPHALTVLAMIITSTPGTVWQELSANKRELTLHVLDLVDVNAWVQKIKQRYEQPLREIFE